MINDQHSKNISLIKSSQVAFNKSDNLTSFTRTYE